MERYILGADPGKYGAIVLINVDDINDQLHIRPKIIDGMIDIMTFYNAIRPYRDSIVLYVKEKVHAIFGASATATFEFGEADGALLTLLTLLSTEQTNVIEVSPKIWQKAVWEKEDIVPGEPILDKTTKKQKVKKDGTLSFKIDTKATSKKAAERIFKGVSFIPKSCRKAHDGLIDAALIAYYGYIKLWNQRKID